MNVFRVAAERAQESTALEVGFLRMFKRRRVELPVGELHAYVDTSPHTYCGISLDTLRRFPDLVWPGGLDLDNPHCPACGEATAGR